MQVLVSVFEPREDAPPEVTEHGFRVDAEYVYPASAIKTLIAIGALRQLKVLGEEHEVKLHVGSRFKRCEWGSGKCEVPEPDEDTDEDDDIDEEKRWVGREITKLLAYSDNHSYDRLYDLVGHEALNRDMKALGLESVRFRHRLVTVSKRRSVRRVIVYPWPGRAFILPPRTSEYDPGPTPAARLEEGDAFRGPKGKVDEPFDFGPKNYVSLRDLHRVTQSLVRPGTEGAIDLGIDEDGRAVILKAMTGHLVKGKRGATHKPLLPGLLEEVPIERLRYVNKAGRAYGFHLDSAYVEDTETKRAFLVTAAIYANPNGVLNDDDYAYDEVSGPFLAAVGQSLARAVLKPASPPREARDGAGGHGGD